MPEACGPSAATSPAISCPIVNGRRTPRDSSEICCPPPKSKNPSQIWTSLWHTPAASTRTTTSPPFGSGSGYSRASSGFPHSMICIARMPGVLRFSVRLVPSDQVRDASDHLVAQLRFAAPKAPQIVAQDLDHIVFIMSGLTCRVRSEEHMLHSPEWRIRCERFFHGHIDPGAGDAPCGERLNKCCLVDDTSASDVHQIGGGFHLTECLGVKEFLGLLGEGTSEGDEIGLGQEGLELGHGTHRVGHAAAGGRIAPQPDDAHIEGFGQLGEASADLPEADDKEHLAAELVLPLGEIADHAAPDPLSLVVARLGKPAAQCKDEGHRVLRDRG